MSGAAAARLTLPAGASCFPALGVAGQLVASCVDPPSIGCAGVGEAGAWPLGRGEQVLIVEKSGFGGDAIVEAHGGGVGGVG